MPYPAMYLDYTEETGSWGAGKAILLERTREIRAGDFLDIEIYPLLAIDKKTAEAKRNHSTERQARANIRRARKRFVRMVNANFTDGDFVFKFADLEAQDEEEAKKHLRNYMRRMKYRARKAGIAFKYVYVMEQTKAGVIHFHGVMTGGWISRDEAEDEWKHERLPKVERARRLQDGLARIALYMTKNKSTQARMMAHKWGGSRNLRKPEEKIRDRKFSKRAIMDLATGAMADARGLFEKKYPEYELIEPPEVWFSDTLPGASVYARMRRKGGREREKNAALQANLPNLREGI